MDLLSGMRYPKGSPNAGQLNTDLASVMLGNMAQAVMGDNQNSWQAQTGKVASNMGQSMIADKRLRGQQQKQNALQQMLVNAILGKGLTVDGEQGPTKTTLDQNADGTFKHVISGNWGSLNDPGNASGLQPNVNPPPAGVRQPGVQAPTPTPTTTAPPSSGPPPAGVPQQNLQNIVPLF